MNLLATFGTQEVILLLFVIPVIFIYFKLLFHAATNRNIQGSQRMMWYFIILFFPLVGCLAYWLVVMRNDRIRSRHRAM